jgi:predicted secreted Zn-dependent protease
MHILRSFLLVMTFILYVSPVYATVYQYFDDEGTLIVTDNPYNIKRPKSGTGNGYQDIKLRYRDDVAYDYYPVTGKNFKELISSTNINGPFDPTERKKYAGQTKWTIGWSYKFNSSYTIDGLYLYVSLNIFDIEFMSDITVLIPMLQENPTLDHSDLKLWEQFSQGLLEHEHDHVNIIKDPFYKDEALMKISSIKQLTLLYGPHADPDTLIKEAVESETARIGHDLIRTIKKQNEEYDRLTEHGLKTEMRDLFFRR